MADADGLHRQRGAGRGATLRRGIRTVGIRDSGWGGLAAMVFWAMASPAMAQPAPGSYRCFVYSNPRVPAFVGTITLTRTTYVVEGQQARGGFSPGPGGSIVFNGPLPMGFAVAGGEHEPGRFRLYPTPADMGNAWRAALCSIVTG